MAESFYSHICVPRFHDTKRIVVDHFTVGKTSYGHDSVLAMTMDGTLITLVISDEQRIPILFNTLNPTPKSDTTEPGRTVR
jgi:hypothetical protein